jgi:Tol biopolymer transport system component
MNQPIPDDAAHRRVWLIVGVLSIVVILVAVGAFAVLATRTPGNKPPAYTPAEETSADASSLATSASVLASGTSGSTATSGTASSTTGANSGTQPKQIVRAALVAYRKDDRIWVAKEDGTGAKAIANSHAGAFALSPDGRTLALAGGPNPATDHCVLIDVATAAQAQLPLAVDLPTWAPDSSWLAYTAGSPDVGYSIRRVDRNGSHDALLVGSGAQPEISADGKRIAYTGHIAANASDPLHVVDISARKTYTVPSAQGALHYAWSSTGVLYFVKDSMGITAGWLGSANAAMTKSSVVASLPTGTNVVPGQLFPSPDGAKILFAMVGDDGYSAMYVADVAGKKITLLSTRRDAYPVQWLLNGSGLLYVEGNAIQKETPALTRVDADGTHKKVLVTGVRL